MWVVEMDNGSVNWVPIAFCIDYSQADALTKAEHIVQNGKPVRIRQYGKAFDKTQEQ